MVHNREKYEIAMAVHHIFVPNITKTVNNLNIHAEE